MFMAFATCMTDLDAQCYVAVVSISGAVLVILLRAKGGEIALHADSSRG